MTVVDSLDTEEWYTVVSGLWIRGLCLYNFMMTPRWKMAASEVKDVHGFAIASSLLSKLDCLHWTLKHNYSLLAVLFATFGSCGPGLQTWCCFKTIFFWMLFADDTSLFMWRAYSRSTFTYDTRLMIQSGACPKRNIKAKDSLRPWRDQVKSTKSTSS